MFKRILSVTVIVSFFLTTLCPLPKAYAGEMVMPLMPRPGHMVGLSRSYTPAHLRGIVIHPDDPFKFDFLVHPGDGNLNETQKKEEYTKLVKYFLAALTVPDKDQWVNLSPYEKNRIIAGDLGQTEMGRDLLEQDYLLKQITSSLMYPESGLGKEFWNKVYEQAYEQYGTTNIPANTFNKVWIVPDEAVVYESGNTAFITKSHLKVMLEEDYLSLRKHLLPNNIDGNNKTHTIASKIIRVIILPAMEQEVNEGKNFAGLRQIFNSMLLATWYKKVLKESLLGKIYADKAKVQGVDYVSSQDVSVGGADRIRTENIESIYQEYLTAFKKGVYNYIKEDQDKYTRQTISRKYFSGGYVNTDDRAMLITRVSQADLAQAVSEQLPKGDEAIVILDRTQLRTQLLEIIESWREAIKFIYHHAASFVSNGQARKRAIALAAITVFSLSACTGGETGGVVTVMNSDVDISRVDEFFKPYIPNQPSLPFLTLSNGRTIIPFGPVIVQIDRAHQRISGTVVAILQVRGPDNQIIPNKYNVILDREIDTLLTSKVHAQMIKVIELDTNKLGTEYDIYPLVDSGSPEKWRTTQGPYTEELKKLYGTVYADAGIPFPVGGSPTLVGQQGPGNLLSSGALPGPEPNKRPTKLSLAADPYSIDKASIAVTTEAWRRGLRSILHLPNAPFFLAGYSEWKSLFRRRGIFAVLLSVGLFGLSACGALPNVPVLSFPVDNGAHIKDKDSFHLKPDQPFEPVQYAVTTQSATSATLDNASIANPGGIDFNSDNFNMLIKRDGKGIPLPLFEQDLAQLSAIKGFTPRIIEIRPLTGNMPFISSSR